ncbi:conserved hypothetical protein [Talaromyces marneffei ATCC 18224]|uniref:Uncharacterized protein n=1 Tax=Talaromyces marneffei (strain ATCC 18224 / CBS 334.59 / QM 7333) TaxID=441960 RepID=B6QD76_TALMQ|nr:conserved hypothetical protein [Talaromyces marneffei ATCC 18224]
MIPSARPRRPQGLFIIVSALASLFFLSVFLWRSADPRIVDPRLSSVLSVAGKNQTTGDEHSSHSLMQGSDEFLDEHESLEHSQDEEAVLKPTQIAHPFSLSLPPLSLSASTPLSSADQSHHVMPIEPAQTLAAKIHPSTHTGDPVNTSQNPRISGKPNNLTISGFVFYGRRDRVESMHCYLERNLVTHGGWLDNVIWVVNTKDSADLAYLDRILARSPLYKTHVLPEQVGWPDYAKIWRIVNRETMYIKIDDDIVWFADDTIERLVKRKLERRDALAVSANIVNNPPLSFLHYHMGALHPYFPDLPKNFDYNTRAALGLKTPWRPSEDPNWTGPDDFEWSLDWTPPPFPNHRWLRVADDKALNRTPVAHLTYEVWGPTYESWAIASQQHYSLLENIETEKLDLYKFDHPWDMKGERIRINFMAILGSDVLDTDVFHWPDNQGDEDMLVLTLPHDTGRPVLIEGTALAAHFNFQHQGGVATTDLLSRYKSLAAERACLVPSPSASD